MSQVPMLHEPPVVFGRSVQFTRMLDVHEVPHEVSLHTSVSQPLPGLPSQFRCDASQVTLQVPLAQVPPVVFGRSVQLMRPLQAVPHELLAQMSTSQPLAALPSQLREPASHEPMVQVPALQLPSATCGRASQSTRPEHRRPHELSAKMSVSQPLAALPSQFSDPTSQLPMLQVPELQLPSVTPGRASQSMRPEHAVPHELSAQMPTSQPLAVLPSQLRKPALQVMLQVPETQVPPPIALGRVPQSTRPVQAVPQLLLLQMFVSQPLAAEASQLKKPALQLSMAQAPDGHDDAATLLSVVQLVRPPHVVPHALFT
jgi:hypothetical protein